MYQAELRTHRSFSASQQGEGLQTMQNLAIPHFLDLQLLLLSLHLLLCTLPIPLRSQAQGPIPLLQLHKPLFHFQLVKHLERKCISKHNYKTPKGQI